MNNFNRILYDKKGNPDSPAFRGILNTLPNTANQNAGTHLGVDHVGEHEDEYTNQRAMGDYLGPRKNRYLTKAR